jgi:hypothetical protein
VAEESECSTRNFSADAGFRAARALTVAEVVWDIACTKSDEMRPQERIPKRIGAERDMEEESFDTKRDLDNRY